jgi:hypothetical protein
MSDNDATPARTPKTAISAPVITVAFPFSQIKTQEPTAQMKELAMIVTALADEIAQMQPSVQTKGLAEQAHALLTDLGG